MPPRPSGPRRTFVPRLEALDDRLCPAATATQIGHTLVVLGDAAAADDVAVQFTGDGTADVFGITPPQDRPFSGVTHLVVKGRGGDDRVRVFMTGNTVSQPLTIQLDLGSGDDSADVNLANFQAPTGQLVPVTIRANLRLFVQGGAGADGAAVRLGAVAGVRADVRARLGAGDDALDGFLMGGVGPDATGQTGGLEAWDVRGGAEDDSLNLYTAAIDLGAKSRLVATLRGEAGDDTVAADMNVAVAPINPLPARLVPAPVQLTLDGGDGADSVLADLVLRTPQANPTGTYYQLAAALRGGAGDDDLWLTLDGGQDQKSSKATVDGGLGTDLYVGPTGPGIRVLGVEE
ncbi:MAG TPA: hypothetical protein VKD90_15635 [Gemmataceae bacterium]|nr:hypothetical protein [Gemmataceae bacterium]